MNDIVVLHIFTYAVPLITIYKINKKHESEYGK